MLRIIYLFMVALVLSALIGCQQRSSPTMEIDARFELLDESGNTVSSDEYSDRLRLVFFGFASCPDICPVTLQNIGIALDSLGPLAEQVTVLFISVDPKRDTPEVLTQYTNAFHPTIIGLTGTYDQLSAVTSGFRTTFGHSVVSDDGQERPLSREEYEELSPSDTYFPYHSSKVYLIGASDELLDLIGYGSTPSQVEDKLRSFIN